MEASKIKELIKQKKIKQYELSELLGITKTQVNNILNGRSDPRFSTISKLSKVLNVSPGYFFSDQDFAGNIKEVEPNYGISELEKCKMELNHKNELLKSKDETIAALKQLVK